MKKKKIFSILLCLIVSATAMGKTEVIQKGAFVLSENYNSIEFPVTQQVGDVKSVLERNGDVILWTLSLKEVGKIGTVTLGDNDCDCNEKFTSEGEMKFPLVKESNVFKKVYYKAEVKMKKGKTLFGEGMVYSFKLEKKISKAGVVHTWEWIFTLVLLVLFEFLMFTKLWTSAGKDDEEGWCVMAGVALTAFTMLLWIFSGTWFPLELAIYLALIGGITHYMWGNKIANYYSTWKKRRIEKKVEKQTEHCSY
ncbi:MAG: hypothetical protein LBO09_00745 [Candidatus Peribacteria bacterium]|jgi:hypothetical protein|nr:hypothetical protein [Candidatus Peribacteria bacterium]